MSSIFIAYADHIGMVGVFLTLIAYYLLNINRLSSMSMSYLLLNLVGSSMLLFSLFYHWNLPAVMIEGAWITISLIGIYRFYMNPLSSKL